MTGAGGFTGAASIPAVDRPMGLVAPVNVQKKKKDRKVVREQAEALVAELLKNSR